MNIKRALISVSDKTGIVEFAKELVNRGIEIITTGGTAKLLAENSIPVKQVSEVTNFPEILGGRVKTLHPKIFGGILADLGDKTHIKELETNQIDPIDMVVVNLYPFDEVQKKTRDEDILIENIDIGGVALLRAAAKNHRNVVVICDPADYNKVIKSLDLCGDVQLHDRRMFALKAFYHTMKYDATIHRVLSELFASEKFDHMTFERFISPQFDYEVLDKVGERFVKLSKYAHNSLAIIIGAIINYLNPNIIVGLSGNLPTSLVDLKKSGNRICELSGEIVALRKLTNDLARKLKESTFSTVAYNEIEDEELIKEILKNKELVRYNYLEPKEKIALAFFIENIMLRKQIDLLEFQEDEKLIFFLLQIMPKYSVIAITEDGYFVINVDLRKPIDALEKTLNESIAKPLVIGTNAKVDSLFKKLCDEKEVEKIIEFST
ncbi:MAG: IMP cyclohydrolase [Fervidobacterium sp.]|nr:IMP cyclohydrolase [Fervidobacterium sp.]